MITQSVAWCLSAHLLSSTVPYSALINQVSCSQHVNPVLVAGIIEQESGFDPTKRRVEDRINDVSIGLMQITTRTARWMGFQGPLDLLYTPSVNVNYGVRYLVWLLQKHPYGADAVAAYNAGTPRWRHGGYVNSVGSYCVERYVVGVLHWTNRIRILTTNENAQILTFLHPRTGESSSSLDKRLLSWLGWPPGTLYPDIRSRTY